MEESHWSLSSWRKKPILQQPEWPDRTALNNAAGLLGGAPPLVFPHEIRSLSKTLASVSKGQGFVLQAGDCAESFTDFSAESVRNKMRVILQMAVVLQYASGVPVVKIGRMAGQFAKPRSDATEVRDGIELPVFRGHMVNELGFTSSGRTPDPLRLLQAYDHSSATLTLLRSLAGGGFADLRHVHSWSQEFVKASPEGERYEAVAQGIYSALAFMESCGMADENIAAVREVDFYVSHEGLILEYEEALTREDPLTGNWYDCSAHTIWVGERTRGVNDAHVEFLSGVANPIGCKLGPSVTPDEALEVCEKLNPERTPGRLTFISRMGADRVYDTLGPIVNRVEGAGHPVVWMCDPMHGNTYSSSTGHKTRKLDDVVSEIEGFFEVHRSARSHAGGIHVELTGDDVTECVGGSSPVNEMNLGENYETMCDPRLNASQSLDLAFRVADFLKT